MANDCTEHAHDRALKAALGIALFFMTIEVIGGWLANSLALISDALHLFTDVGALLLSMIVLQIAKRPSTREMSFGYHRAEILGALASALSLWILSGVLIYEAIDRLIHPPEVHGAVVFVIASIGLVANLLMLHQLHGGHHHNLNVKAAYLHVIGDLLGSIGVIASGLIIWFTQWYPADPLITILCACMILYNSGKIVRQTIKILMQSTPEEIDPVAVERDLLNIPGVKEVHDLHIWAVTTKKIALSAHLIADSGQMALREAHRILEEKHGIRHMTIQIEDRAHFESRYCYDCTNGNGIK